MAKPPLPAASLEANSICEVSSGPLLVRVTVYVFWSVSEAGGMCKTAETCNWISVVITGAPGFNLL